MIKKTLNCIQHSISQVSIQNLGIVFEEKGHSTKTIDMKPTLYIYRLQVIILIEFPYVTQSEAIFKHFFEVLHS